MNVWSFSKNGEFTIAIYGNCSLAFLSWCTQWMEWGSYCHTNLPGFQLWFEERLILKNQTLVVYHNHNQQKNGSLTTKHVFWNRKFTTRNEVFQATITGTWPTKRLCHHCQQQKEGFTDTSGNGGRISILGWSALYFHQPIHLPSGYLT